MMNLYDYHDKPETIHKHSEKENIPALFYHRLFHQGDRGELELHNRDKYLAKSPEFAYRYAYSVLARPFPAGEDAIAKEAKWAYRYARFVLKGRFKKGEAAIATDPNIGKLYQEFLESKK